MDPRTSLRWQGLLATDLIVGEGVRTKMKVEETRDSGGMGLSRLERVWC